MLGLSLLRLPGRLARPALCRAMSDSPPSSSVSASDSYEGRPPSMPLQSSSSPGLLLSDSCVRQLNKLSSADSAVQTALRITVEGGGCSGFQYKFDLEDDPQLAEDDR